MNIANVVFISMANKHKKIWVLQMLCLFQWQINIKNMGIASFVLMIFCVYGSIVAKVSWKMYESTSVKPKMFKELKN